jgi:hypothetical protein
MADRSLARLRKMGSGSASGVSRSAGLATAIWRSRGGTISNGISSHQGAKNNTGRLALEKAWCETAFT